MPDRELYELAERAGRALEKRGWMVATAESCTGGWVAEAITMIPGSSAWFDRGFVTYTNDAKREMLGVSGKTLERHGAVSEEVVREMVAGALGASRAQVALAVSGGTLDRHGAVSEEVVREMVTGALGASRAQVALAVSGVAGPSGGSPEKPVGTVCFAWGQKNFEPRAETQHLAGDREAVRRQSVVHALEVLLAMVEEGANRGRLKV